MTTIDEIKDNIESDLLKYRKAIDTLQEIQKIFVRLENYQHQRLFTESCTVELDETLYTYSFTVHNTLVGCVKTSFVLDIDRNALDPAWLVDCEAYHDRLRKDISKFLSILSGRTYHLTEYFYV